MQIQFCRGVTLRERVIFLFHTFLPFDINLQESYVSLEGMTRKILIIFLIYI